MKPRTPSRRDPIGHARRRATAQRRVGAAAACACGESRPAALIAGTSPTTCAHCTRLRKGKTTLDKHHPAGRANDPTTVPIPTNDHIAVLTEAQHDWPPQTRENSAGDPLLRFAASVRGFCDTLLYLAKRLLLSTAQMLEIASRYFTDTLGPFWWRGTPLEAFAPAR
jgi:hypothetical protein